VSGRESRSEPANKDLGNDEPRERERVLDRASLSGPLAPRKRGEG
jgi:hypothetical protein